MLDLDIVVLEDGNRYNEYENYIETLTKDNHPDFKSEGERQVARLFYKCDIPFFYEEPVIVKRWGRYHWWEPDFLLPSFNWILVEYAGVENDDDYTEQLENKIRTYYNHKIPLEVIKPHDIKGERWEERVLAKLLRASKRATHPRYEDWVIYNTELETTLWGTGREIKGWDDFEPANL